MANGMVKGKYIEYIPSECFRALADKAYSDEKFETWYSNHPDKMTPGQIKLCGYDKLRSTLWEKYIDKKYESIYIAEFETAKQVIEQILPEIKKVAQGVKIEVSEGNLKKGYNPKVTLPTIKVGDFYNGEYAYLSINITLCDEEEQMFQINYNTPYFNDSRYVNDTELIDEIKKLVSLYKTGIMPKVYVNKVVHWVDNQYELYSGEHCIKLYDIEMIQMYHTLAKEFNEKFGSAYPYSQKVIDKLHKHEVHGNIQQVGGFYIKDSWHNKFRLLQWYYYDSCGRCETTYGEWSKEELIELIDSLKPYVVNSEYFFNTSIKSLGKKYGDYDKIGILYKSKPNYYKDLLWED